MFLARAVAEAAVFAAEAGHGVADDGGEIPHQRRGGHELEAGLGPAQRAFPAAHGDDAEATLGADRLGHVEHAGGLGGHAGEFAHGEAVDVGDAEGADAAHPLAVEVGAVDLEAAEGVGAVEHDHLHAVGETRIHGVAHHDVERVAADADVLQVHHEGVEALELGGGGFAVFAVKGVDGQAGAGVAVVAEVDAGLDQAVEPVLGGEEGDEFYPRGLVEHVDGAAPEAVHPGGVGQEADTLALHGREAVGGEHVDAEEDGRGDRRDPHGRDGRHRGRRGGARRGGGGAAAAEEADEKQTEAEQGAGNAEHGPGRGVGVRGRRAADHVA